MTTPILSMLVAAGFYGLISLWVYSWAKRFDARPDRADMPSTAAGVALIGAWVLPATIYWRWTVISPEMTSPTLIGGRIPEVAYFIHGGSTGELFVVAAIVLLVTISIPIFIGLSIFRTAEAGHINKLVAVPFTVGMLMFSGAVTIDAAQTLFTPYKSCATTSAGDDATPEALLAAVRGCVKVEDWVPDPDKCAREVFADDKMWAATLDPDWSPEALDEAFVTAKLEC